MAQVTLRFGRGGAPSPAGGVAQVFDAFPQVEELASSGTSSTSTIEAKHNDVARVTNHGTGIIWVTFGAAPTAAVETTHPIGPGLTEDLGPIGAGMKMAVIDDS